MKDLYNTYPKITVEKIGTKNTTFYIHCRRDYGAAYVETTGTPYRVTDGETTFVLYIHKHLYCYNGKREYSNYYTITEESTGMAIQDGKTFKKALEFLTGDLNQIRENGGNIDYNISYVWEKLKRGVDFALKSDYAIKNKISYEVETATGEIKSIDDYPPEIQNRYFRIALAKETRKKAKK